MKSFFSSIHTVPDDILDAYTGLWKPYEVPRKTIMTLEGETEKYLYFVEKGIQKSYYITKGKEHIIAFTYPQSFSGIPESFLSQTPSNYFLESITDSSFLRISHSEHLSFLENHAPIERLFRKATEHILIGTLQRLHELMAHDIETRFKTFVERSPHLLNMVSQKDLASYLRIDPTNFSKLLNSIKV